ncbi:MAG: hypothetical protein DLM70_07515 [Chloroflexi bacterium]|nr:MAG: hypothetical protein DLM70_07515 [Chloroflexota bacterium]
MLTACAPFQTKAVNDDSTRPPHQADIASNAHHTLKSVFVIVMENHNWADIKGSPSAPYINHVLLPAGSHAE